MMDIAGKQLAMEQVLQSWFEPFGGLVIEAFNGKINQMVIDGPDGRICIVAYPKDQYTELDRAVDNALPLDLP